MASGIASVGECMLELSGQGGDSWRMGYAGDTFNTLWTLRALTRPEHSADYVSGFGDDPFSIKQIAFFRDNGIGIAASPVIAGARPGLYAITLTGAERSFTYWRSEAAARQLASDPIALHKSLENRALVYFSGITLAILSDETRKALLDAIAKVRAAKTLVAFDPNYRPRLWADAGTAKAAFEAALSTADIALPTFPDEQALFGDATPRETAKRLKSLGVSEIVVKNGEAEALIAHGDLLAPSPATSVANPVDTTGAGDSFNGGYLAARLAGDTPVQAAVRAHRVAGAVIQVRGALAPFEMLRAAFNG